MRALIHPLTALRIARHLSQVEFAKFLGVDRTSLAKVENGQRDRLSPDSCVEIEQKTMGLVTLKELMAWRWPESVKAAGGIHARSTHRAPPKRQDARH